MLKKICFLMFFAVMMCGGMASAEEPIVSSEGRAFLSAYTSGTVTFNGITYKHGGSGVRIFRDGCELFPVKPEGVKSSVPIGTRGNWMYIEQFNCDGNLFLAVSDSEGPHATLFRINDDNELIGKFSIFNDIGYSSGMRLFVYNGRLYAWYFPPQREGNDKALVVKFCWYAPERTFQIEEKFKVDVNSDMNPLRLNYIEA